MSHFSHFGGYLTMAFRRLVAALSFAAGVRSAAEEAPTFANNVSLSALFVSPAQFYQVQRGVAHADATFAQFEARQSIDDLDRKLAVEGTQYGLIVATPIVTTNARIGVVYYDQNLKTKVTTATGPTFGNTSDTDTIKNKERGVGPVVAWDIAQRLSVGFTYLILDTAETDDDGGDASFHFTTFTPGVTFHQSDFEIGVVYKPTIAIREREGSETSVGSTTLHTQARFGNLTSVGGSVKHGREKALDDDAKKNNVEVTLAAEHNVSATVIAGLSGSYETIAAKHESDKTPFNITNAGFSATLDHVVSGSGAVGAQVSYVRTGKQSGKLDIGLNSFDSKLEMSGTTMAVSGTYFF